MARFIDLSHAVGDGDVTYPGLPAPRVAAHVTFEASRSHYAAGTEFEIARIEMVANTGTYLDAPSHRFRGRSDVAALPLEALADLAGVCVDARAVGRAIQASVFGELELRGRAVLVLTGWSRHFGTPQYGAGHPFMTAEAARALVERGAALAGIDSLNIDDTADGSRPAHTALLAASIPIVEHLRGLEELPRQGFRFLAVPPRLRGLGSAPVRAFAIA